jgi:hypothetical protein
MSATTGNDTFSGTNGPDTLDGLAGDDSISGLDGADSITGNTGNDTILGGLGNDTLRGDVGNDSVDGGDGADSLTGSFGNDTLVGGDGNDRLLGGDANDVLYGGNGADSLNGGVDDDSLFGEAGADSLFGDTGNDTLSGGDDADTLVGAAGDDLLDGGAGDDLVSYAANTAGQGINVTAAGGSDGLGGTDSFVSIERITGGAGADTMTFAGGGVTLSGGGGDDLLVIGGGGSSLDGGSGTDTLAFTFNGTVTVSGGSLTGPGGFNATVSGMELIRLADGSTTAFGDGSFVVCFVAGTRILTARGEKPVESLRPGELVATLSGQGSPLKPVLFLGRRRIALAGNPHAAELAPVRIRAGALGENTPHRDLLVSPDHCLYLDGALVPARLLVNGGSIAVEKGLAEVTYFHIELPAHDVVLAEGAAAESWLDAGNRSWFENASTALLRVSATLDAHTTEDVTPCAPVIQAGPRLAAIRDRIALLAAAANHNHRGHQVIGCNQREKLRRTLSRQGRSLACR